MHGFAARLVALLALVVVVTGCAGTRGPAVVAITGQEYDVAFDASIDVVRKVGMPAELIDRRTGILETEYRVAGTVLEPWRRDSTTLAGSIESTINHERRKARIEFVPVRFAGDPGANEPLAGPDLAGERFDVLDLTTYEGRIELRAWVQLERSTVVGRRRGEWSRRSVTMTIHPDAGLGPSQTFWTPVARDEALERALLREIERAIARRAAEADESPEGEAGEASESPDPV